jgi:hypothetical protein
MTEKFSEQIKGTQKALDLLKDNRAYFTSVLQEYYSEKYDINFNFAAAEEEDNEEE